VDIYINIVLVY